MRGKSWETESKIHPPGKVGEMSEIKKIKSGKSRGIQLRIPHVREKSRNLVKLIPSQGKVWEFSEMKIKSGKSRGTGCKISQAREKSGN